MKNVHILPTDKPRFDKYLVLNKESKICIWDTKVMGSQTTLHTQNIYITSNEEIKEGDWYYNERLNQVFQAIRKSGYNTVDREYKIILTTDPHLIKDGVQPISNEFLEWFVKNPSCEEISIEWLGTYTYGIVGYKIIIPKEETTAYHYLSCCRSVEECHCGKYPKQELERGITITHVGRQETLEESAERIAMTKDWDFESSEGNGYYDYVEGFTEGAKSDAARDYWYAKWQQERMYSEEEVKTMFNRFTEFISHHDIEEWQNWIDKQFKKK